MKQIEQGSWKYGYWNLKKITVCPNEPVNEDWVVAFTGGYEKIVSEVQTQRVNVDKWYSTWLILFLGYILKFSFNKCSKLDFYDVLEKMEKEKHSQK